MLVLGAGATLLAGAPVHAATVGLTVLGQGDARQAVFTYRASAGERNSVGAWMDGQAVYLEDERRLHAAGGCSEVGDSIIASSVRCTIPAGVSLRASVFHLGDGGDHISLEALPGVATVLGGWGDDTIEAGRTRARLKGGAGDDELSGSP